MSYFSEKGKIERAFDLASVEYDDDFGRNPIGVWMRERVWERLMRYFKSGDNVLEIGCGTGIDALFLAQQGIHVLASDISPAMVEILRKKAVQYNLSNLIETRIIGTDSLKTYAEENASRFDGILSNFGPLNCEPHIQTLPQVFKKLLKPKGIVLATIMNKYCLWEMLYFLLKGSLKQAQRRFLSKGVKVNVSSINLTTYYYSHKEIVSYFAPHFKILKITGLPTFLPPPYLVAWYNRFQGIFGRLEVVEKWLSSKPFFNACGDHFLIEMRSS